MSVIQPQVDLDEENGTKMPSFMLEIEQHMRPPLEQLALDFFANRSGLPSFDFCKQCSGLKIADEKIAARLGVAISTVRGWREVGRRL